MPGPIIDIEADEPGGRPARRSGGIGCGSIIAGLFVVLLLAKTIASTVIDYQWWHEVGQLETWWQQLYVHTAPIFYVTLFGYGVLWLVNARALKAAGTSLGRNRWYARISSLALVQIGRAHV